ncbi:hypothetical protein ILUMI_03752 [Ignelater luminosus]|uniref:ZAD domain-containing protein n=1 Tax=Ignelater luminosus TaxID=2038154 RepID=A0A8K0DDX4_IGNLU|nr:hypothetical protein ILUMI_03752 [Ignelater luminosus]
MLSVNGLLVHVNKLNKGKVVSKIQMTVTNKVEEIDLETSCRICLMKQNSEDLFSAFGSNKMFRDFSIAAGLMECFGIEIKQDQNLPSCVCIKCASTTLQCYTFKKCLEKCQGYLEQWRKRDVEQNQSNNNQNKENTVPETSGILYNYLSSKTVQQGNAGSGNVIFVSKSVSNKKHAIISTSSPATCILAEHNYHKGIQEGPKIQDCVIDLVEEDTLSSKSENLNENEMPEYHTDDTSQVKKPKTEPPVEKRNG